MLFVFLFSFCYLILFCLIRRKSIQKTTVKDEKIDLEYMVDAFTRLKNNFDSLDFPTKKSLLKLIIEKLTWSDGKLKLIFNSVWSEYT